MLSILYNDTRAKHLENPASASAGVALAHPTDYLITDADSNDRLTQKFPYTYASSTNPSQNPAQFSHQLEQLKPQKKNNHTLNTVPPTQQKTTVLTQPEATTASNSSSTNNNNSSALASFDSLTSQLKQVLENTIEQKIDQEKTKFQLNMSKQRQEFRPYFSQKYAKSILLHFSIFG